jgi:hypothetical protein
MSTSGYSRRQRPKQRLRTKRFALHIYSLTLAVNNFILPGGRCALDQPLVARKSGSPAMGGILRPGACLFYLK